MAGDGVAGDRDGGTGDKARDSPRASLRQMCHIILVLSSSKKRCQNGRLSIAEVAI